MCGAARQELAVRYETPPAGETDFGIPPGEYSREYHRCSECGHFAAALELDLARLYSGEYVDATYAEGKLLETYERINALPPERSDNVQRVERIDEWWGDARPATERTLLDVGSGLGVFPARMKQRGWTCTALDPDPRAVRHARDDVGVDAVQADFMKADDLGPFNLVTFNKVLEHVDEPVAMLARSRAMLGPQGAVYVELPDGEAAATDPTRFGREEFFIEHLHVFSTHSLSALAERAGFTTEQSGRLREPSGKYTLYAFLTPEDG